MCEKCVANTPPKYRDDKEYAALRTMQLGAIAIAFTLESAETLGNILRDINDGMDADDQFTLEEVKWLLDTFLTATSMRADMFYHQLMARDAARN